MLSDQQDPYRGKVIVQPHGDSYLVQNPPDFPLTTEQLDRTYELPYTGTYHPMYESAGGIPALSEVKFSITSSRGCYGCCSFCALTFHQGRIISARSHDSIVREAKRMIAARISKEYSRCGAPPANLHAPPVKNKHGGRLC